MCLCAKKKKKTKGFVTEVSVFFFFFFFKDKKFCLAKNHFTQINCTTTNKSHPILA